MVFLLCLFTLLTSFAVGAPVPRAEESLSWAASPPTRGTLSILFSCAAALGLCVWTGVHLNVDPIEDKTKKHETTSKVLGKVVWAFIALLAPDIILAIALHQRLVAERYRDEVNKVSKDSLRAKADMPLKMAFFAIMGGFSREYTTVDGTQRYSLKVNDIYNVGMMDRIHDYPLHDINDKSKASGIAKFVAVIQAGWILLQCFGRKMEGIYITLLELNTAVHVIIGIVMYCIWWEKPADINQPITIDRRGTHESNSSAYRNCISQALIEAGRILRENLTEDTTDNQPGHKEAWVTVVVCGSIKRAPEETAQKVKHIPFQIGKYFHDLLLRDIRNGVIDAYRDTLTGAATIPLSVTQAALNVAFEVAHETAFKVAHKTIYYPIRDLASADLPDSELPEELKKALDIACAATRMATFKAAFEAAFHAASQESTRRPNSTVTDYSASTAALNKSTDSMEQQLTVESPQSRLHSLKAALRAARAATRSASRQAVRLSALNAALDKSTVSAAASSAFRAFIIENLHKKDDTSAFYEGNSHSINPAGPGPGLQRADSSLAFAYANFDPNNNDIKVDIDRVVGALRVAIEEAFHEQYRTGINRANIGSDLNSTVKIVKEATFSGIYKAACLEIAEAKEQSGPKLAAACTAAERELLEFKVEHERRTTRTERLKGSFLTAGEVVWGQLIDVPHLFWLRTDKFATAMLRATVATAAVTAAVEKSAPTRKNTIRVNEYDTIAIFDKKWQRNHRLILLFTSGITGIFYGGFHLTKWNNGKFPTMTEQLLWRIFCCVGTSTVFPAAALLFIPFTTIKAEPLRRFCIILTALLCLVFLGARAYIIVESFISLRALPRDAFQTVQWSLAIPHI